MKRRTNSKAADESGAEYFQNQIKCHIQTTANFS